MTAAQAPLGGVVAPGRLAVLTAAHAPLGGVVAPEVLAVLTAAHAPLGGVVAPGVLAVLTAAQARAIVVAFAVVDCVKRERPGVFVAVVDCGKGERPGVFVAVEQRQRTCRSAGVERVRVALVQTLVAVDVSLDSDHLPSQN